MSVEKNSNNFLPFVSQIETDVVTNRYSAFILVKVNIRLIPKTQATFKQNAYQIIKDNRYRCTPTRMGRDRLFAFNNLNHANPECTQYYTNKYLFINCLTMILYS